RWNIREQTRGVQFLVRPKLPHLIGELGHYLLPFPALGRRNPAELNPAQVNAERVKQFAEQYPPAPRVIVARGVVAIAGMAAGDQHAIGAHFQRLDNQVEIDSPGAGQANDAHVRGVLEPRGSRQIGAQVRAPVAHVGDDLRLEFLCLAHARLSTSAYTCWSVNPCRSALFDGQTETQVPQPMHNPGFTLAVFLMNAPLGVRSSARSIA